MILKCYILDRKTVLIKSTFMCDTWEVNRDYLTNEKSSFITSGQYTASEGDFFMAKEIGNVFTDKDQFGTMIKPFYFGIIESFEQDAINVCDIYNMANFEIFTKNKSGTDLLTDTALLIVKYIMDDYSKLGTWIAVKTNLQDKISYSFTYDDPPIVMTFVDYLIQIFKNHNVIWSVDSIRVNDTGEFLIQTKLERSTKILNIKNNVYEFVNWDVYIQPKGTNGINGLIIINKNSTDMYNPNILDKWYLTSSGNISQQSLIDVSLPTRDKVYLYDTTATDKPTYQEIAKSELIGNEYSHEITFDILKDNKIINFKDLEMGMLANIMYNGQIYRSVLTGYNIKNNSNFITLKFGYTRSTFQQILKK